MSKIIRFKRVKIVKGIETIEYDEAICDFRNHVRSVDEWMRLMEGNKHVDRMYVKHRGTCRRPPKRLTQDLVRWYVLDSETNARIGRFDDIYQAKRFCIRNGYDFGMY